MNVFDVLENGARRFPAKDAVRFQETQGTKTFSYGEIHRLATCFSGALFQLGIRRGDRLAVFLPNLPEVPAVTYGAFRIGAVPVLLSSALKKEKVEEYVRDSQARVLVTSEALYAETVLARENTSLEEIFVIGSAPDNAKSFPYNFDGEAPPKLDLGSNDPATILYTSGTTG